MEQTVNVSDLLALDDGALVAQCDVHTYKASGPGGQHRNKVSSAVRLVHRQTAVTGHGDDSRSQHQNKALAIKRLRMNLALRLRQPLPNVDPAASSLDAALPQAVAECFFVARKGPATGSRRLQVGPKDRRFWNVAALLLDAIEHFQGRLADVAAWLGITTGNLSSVLGDERHLLSAASEIRKRHGLGPIR